MFDSQKSLLPESSSHEPLSVLIVGEEEDSLVELQQLLTTLGPKVKEKVFFQSRKIHPATYIGQGKLEEIDSKRKDLKIDAVAFDLELSPNQLKNIEKALSCPILDRPSIILEIFSKHARTKEAKVQVELAKLQYLLPRLAHYWTHFERQRGGIGLKGMGETQIEVDRRLVKNRMSHLKGVLKEVEKERKIRREGRIDVLKVAIVGYTNAGKSTLLNALTKSHVLAENKLFATLDASIRALDPEGHPPVVAIDTVGFIRKLPHDLVASFRSTLEEMMDADMILHVLDASSKMIEEEKRVTEELLEEMGLSEKDRVVVLNKSDLVTSERMMILKRAHFPKAWSCSSLNPEEVENLRLQLLEYVRKSLQSYEVLIPYDESKLQSKILDKAVVDVIRYFDHGTFLKIRVEERWAKKFNLEKYFI